MTYEEFLQRYRFDQQDQTALLGAGGFGSVYKAYDLVQKRFVAVKVAEVKHEKFNLLYEKRIVDELDTHENVARYGNCFRFQFMPVRYDFAILTFYEEGNLADVLTKYALTIVQKHQILEGILKGVGHLHKHHIIHRDMKPQNVLMEKQENRWVPKLTDFGLSKLADSNTHAVENSSIGVSIAFAAPEQIKNQEIRHNVDLWAVGVIAYQMFVGELPFEAPRTMSQESWNLEVSKLIVKAKVSEKISAVSEPYRTIIKKCLVADSSKRVQKAEELLQILGPSQASESTQKTENEDYTFRAEEPFLNIKELVTKADALARDAGTKVGFERERLFNEAIKAYEEIVQLDPSNGRARQQIESCRQKIKPKTELNIKQLPSKKIVILGAAIVAGVGFMYFFYWQYNAKKELSWAKATYFSKILYADTLQTYSQIFLTLDKYSGTTAMDDTTNNMLGTFYQIGRGGAQANVEKAMNCYDKATDYEWADYNLGFLHFWGRGTKKDFETAVPYFEKAYKIKQLTEAADYLGYIYVEGGYGVKRDYEAAKSWFEKAVVANSSYSQHELGKMYLKGLGMPVNSDRARYYFNLAANQGNRDAQVSLQNLNNNRNTNNYGVAMAPYQPSVRQKTSKSKSNAGNFWKKAAQDIFQQALRK